MQQSRHTQQDHDDANVRDATAQALAGNTAVSIEGDLKGGQGTTGRERASTPVYDGHSRSTTDTRNRP